MDREMTKKEIKRYIDMVDSLIKRSALIKKLRLKWFVKENGATYSYYPYTIYTEDGYDDRLSPLAYYEIFEAKSKDELRSQAQEYQMWASEQSLSMFEISGYNAYFERLGKRFGLLKEFRTNGVI